MPFTFSNKPVYGPHTEELRRRRLKKLRKLCIRKKALNPVVSRKPFKRKMGQTSSKAREKITRSDDKENGYEADVDDIDKPDEMNDMDDMEHLPCCYHPQFSLVGVVDDDDYVESKNESEEDKVTKSMIIKLGHDLVHRLMGKSQAF